jgi:hypothetical protein
MAGATSISCFPTCGRCCIFQLRISRSGRLTVFRCPPTMDEHSCGVTLIGSCAVSSWGNYLFHRVGLATFLFVSFTLAGAQSKGLPPGPMQTKVKAACTQCHAASKVTSQHKTRQQWSTQLDKMIGLGAEVPDSQRAAFLNYLTKNFGPEKSAKTASKQGGDEAK